MNKNHVHLAISPVGWSNDDMPEIGAEITFEQCIREMALAGYAGSEIGNKYPKDPNKLKRHLKKRGLTICSQWFSAYLCSQPFPTVEEAFRKQINFLSHIGARVIGPSEQTRSCQGNASVPVFSGKAEFNREEWKKLTKGMDSLGKIAKEEGFTLAYHHHMGTGVETLEETRRFLNDTHSDYVHLVFDTGHFAYSGENPVACLKEVITRVGHIHLKDIRLEVLKEVKRKKLSFLQSVLEGIFTVPGDGSIDFSSVFRVLNENDYEGWMVVEAEQDPAKANPLEYAVKARNYIRELAGI